MVLRKWDNRYTVDALKQDLAHIRHLLVIRAEVWNRDLYVGLASINTAVQARTYLMSQ